MDLNYLHLIESERTSGPTRKALLGRAAQEFPNAPLVIDRDLYRTLQAVVGRLLPQTERTEFIDLAAWLDYNLFHGAGNGWRYSDMPNDRASLQAGLRLLNASALAIHRQPFADLSGAQMDDLLGRVQRQDLRWPALNAQRWFEELLTDATELFVSHPHTLADVGFSGIAILPKWEHVGLNDAEPWEPRSHE